MPCAARYFNPRSREGSDLLRGRVESHLVDFNPRSREGSDRPTRLLTTGQTYFNPRSREGSDPAGRIRCQDQHVISIHAPVKGATSLRKRQEIHHADFNPRSREGSDQCEPGAAEPGMISIHAPVKGATAPVLGKGLKNVISIHAPVKGATAVLQYSSKDFINFNPRSREGSDRA